MKLTVKSLVFLSVLTGIFLAGISAVYSQGIFIDLGKTEFGRYMNLVGNTGNGAIKNTFISPEYCAQNTGTTMYFTIDDKYMYKRKAGTYTMVNVEYYDAPDVEIKLVYDGIGNASKAFPTTIKTAGTNSWKSYNFFLDDAYFGNGMTNSADLSLVAAKGTMSINAIKVIAIDAYIDFGTVNDAVFMTQKQIQTGDSKHVVKVVNGEECFTTSAGANYLYVAVNDTLVFDGNHPNLFVAVEYFDENPAWRFRVQYDSQINKTESTSWTNGKGWNSFRTYTFELTNAKFANRGNGLSDMRINVDNAPNLAINRIMVGVLETAPLPVTTNIAGVTTFQPIESPTVDGSLLEWSWLPEMKIEPAINAAGVRTDEFYRTWLLNPENVPVAEAGEPGVVNPGVAGLWDTADLSGGYRAIWDSTSLYFAVTVKDNVLDVTGTSWQEKDGFGFYMDVAHTYSTTNTPLAVRDEPAMRQGENFLFFPAADGDPGLWIHNGVEAGEALPVTVIRKITKTATGYILEAAVPLSLLRDNLTWKPNVKLSPDDFDPLFAFVLNDADNVGAKSGRLMYGGHSADDEFWGQMFFEGIALVDKGLTINFGKTNIEQFIVQTEKSGDGLTEIAEKGGMKCAKLSAGYAYLNVDDIIMNAAKHPHLLVSVEYFDAAGTGDFNIQYDAGTSAPYKDTPNYTSGSTETWKTAVFEINDADFAGRQNGKADLRIRSSSKNLHVRQVRIGIADLWIDLGKTNVGMGIAESNNTGDGIRAVATVGGLECKRNTVGDVLGGPFFYHNVKDSLILNGNYPELFLTIEYYDTLSSGGFSLNYDGSTALVNPKYTSAEGNAFISGSRQWKLHTWYLTDALFNNLENGLSDFRVGGLGNGYSYINRVVIGSMKTIVPKTGVEKNMPFSFRLDQNYPNPFNPTTTIRYEVGKPADISLKIYNVNGQLVRTLVDAKHAAGKYQVVWDGNDNMGFKIPSGLYIYRYSAGDYVRSFKMVLVK